MECLDHLVYATPHLRRTVEDLTAAFGVAPSAGGPHPGRGTANYLLGIGPRSYLEIIGPDTDPRNPAPDVGRHFGIDTLGAAALVAWATRVASLDDAIARCTAAGYYPGSIFGLSRRRPDGVLLEWRVVRHRHEDSANPGGVLPFLIDWGACPHPSETTPEGVELRLLTAEHPEPALVKPTLEALDLPLEIQSGQTPRLNAMLTGRNGDVELRGGQQ